jgi:hypothetical protein
MKCVKGIFSFQCFATLGEKRAHRLKCLCHTSSSKKLRYMSKIAAIFPRTDNTHLSCTQPIANLLIASL